MEIAFFTEMGFTGKVPRTHENMRTEFAWMCALNATHYPINSAHQISYETKIDLGIVIIPKTNPDFNIESIKSVCDKVAVMQEGPHWYFQDYNLEKQINYYNILTSADTVYVHNRTDKVYYRGLTGHSDVRVMNSLMIEQAIGDVKEVERKGVIIGGNFVSWYGGFDSYMVANSQFEQVTAPSMGRKQEGEEQLLGYKGLDTQELCHPDLTVEIGNLGHAKELIKELNTNNEFYSECCEVAKHNYKERYHESKFKI